MDKKIVLLGMAIGSFIGGYLPTLFGADSFSFTALFGNFVGGILGIWLSFRFLQ
jgi:uncharacterized membrane protein YeaQ/YmgE (transglycosylase-associated protein family)